MFYPLLTHWASAGPVKLLMSGERPRCTYIPRDPFRRLYVAQWYTHAPTLEAVHLRSTIRTSERVTCWNSGSRSPTAGVDGKQATATLVHHMTNPTMGGSPRGLRTLQNPPAWGDSKKPTLLITSCLAMPLVPYRKVRHQYS
eukprot:TRINITY_DN4566_c0_g1_i4.p1 TRINITY_DN4566_c0_g1~~TRINITY_DN4566_c0_g1_i4.p1  ORF type:complete len:142 (-),score=0.33 TRINITY_DN4566_c0_g1_i4:694-1119(-)